MVQEEEQDDTARSLPGLFIHDSWKVIIMYSGNSGSGSNTKGFKDAEKEVCALSKTVMTEGAERMAGKERAV